MRETERILIMNYYSSPDIFRQNSESSWHSETEIEFLKQQLRSTILEAKTTVYPPSPRGGSCPAPHSRVHSLLTAVIYDHDLDRLLSARFWSRANATKAYPGWDSTATPYHHTITLHYNLWVTLQVSKHTSYNTSQVSLHLDSKEYSFLVIEALRFRFSLVLRSSSLDKWLGIRMLQRK